MFSRREIDEFMTNTTRGSSDSVKRVYYDEPKPEPEPEPQPQPEPQPVKPKGETLTQQHCLAAAKVARLKEQPHKNETNATKQAL